MSTEREKNLLTAAELGSVKDVAALLDQGVNVQCKDQEDGLTALHWAAASGQDATITFLLNKRAEIEAKDNNGWTALHMAAKNGHHSTVNLLLDKGAKIEAKNKVGSTVLLLSAANGRNATVKLILDRGAEIKAKNKHEDTALHLAAANGHDATVTLLLERGAEIKEKNDYGSTALHWAAANGRQPTVTLLLNKGADIKAKDNGGRTAQDVASEQIRQLLFARMEERNSNRSPNKELRNVPIGPSSLAAQDDFHLAAANGHHATVTHLLDRGAEMKQKTNHEDKAAGKDHDAEAKVKVRKHRPKPAPDGPPEAPPLTALEKNLLTAAEFGRVEEVAALLDQGVNVQCKDQEDWRTALHKAASNGHHATVTLLLDRGADIQAKNKDGWTALHWATLNEDHATMFLLLKKGVEMEAKTKIGSTALHWAATNGKDTTVALLLDKGADIKATDDSGSTALHLAAANGKYVTVALLLRKGAEIGAKDKNGRTARDVASTESIRKLLVDPMQRKINLYPEEVVGPPTKRQANTYKQEEDTMVEMMQGGGFGNLLINEEFIALQMMALKQYEQERDRGKEQFKLPPSAVFGKGHVATAPQSLPPPAPVPAVLSPPIEIFRLLSTGENPGAIPYASLREWTGDFVVAPAGDGPHGLLGKGTFGEVFKGLAVPPEGMGGETAAAAVRLAVKRMNIGKLQLDAAGVGGPPEPYLASFLREIHLLSCFRHPNIVRLIGFSEPCPERQESPCLVYELLALGSLSSQLRDDGQAKMLHWHVRVDILLQISTAINYLHCHNPGCPAYHRDIKADNIALSADYTAKLIDCGLSKYIAEDGHGRSIHSATGGRFGTPGYMCPFYSEGSTIYNAKSEIYSFGIVLLEVLTGILQGSSGGGVGGKRMLHRSDDLAADTRAGTWPEECTRQLFNLGRQCITKYEDRIETIATVMQRLSQIKADYFSLFPAAESPSQQKIAVLVTEIEKMRLERDVSNAASAQSVRKCLVCYDDERHGFECSANRHFVCTKNGCFAQITKHQAGFKARFSENGCKILCTVPGCGEVVPDHDIGTYAGKDGFDAFLRAKCAANAEKLIADCEERVRAEKAEKEKLVVITREAALLRYKNHIIEELLTIKCPNQRCKVAFIVHSSFDECFALNCRQCGSKFCGWCLRNFGKDDAHGHTAGCRPQHLKPRGLFPQKDHNGRYSAKQCFDQVHGPRRAAAVKAYLDEQCLQGTEREAVITAVEEQWNTCGVTLMWDNIELR